MDLYLVVLQSNMTKIKFYYSIVVKTEIDYYAKKFVFQKLKLEKKINQILSNINNQYIALEIEKYKNDVNLMFINFKNVFYKYIFYNSKSNFIKNIKIK